MSKKEYRCKFEKKCDTLMPIFRLMERMDKRSIDHVFLRGAYEVFLKKYCNDVNLCKRCPNYQKYSRQERGQPKKVISNVTLTSDDDEIFDPGWEV